MPVDTLRAVEDGQERTAACVERGLPTVLSQTFRTLIHSRLTVGHGRLRAAVTQSADVVLLEPQRDDYRMFFTNIFSFSSRQAVCEHAYQATRRDLLRRYDELAPILARHGLTLRRDVLIEDSRDLWTGVGLDSGERRDRVKGAVPAGEALGRALDTLTAWVAEQEAAGHAPAEPTATVAASDRTS